MKGLRPTSVSQWMSTVGSLGSVAGGWRVRLRQELTVLFVAYQPSAMQCQVRRHQPCSCRGLCRFLSVQVTSDPDDPILISHSEGHSVVQIPFAKVLCSKGIHFHGRFPGYGGTRVLITTDTAKSRDLVGLA